MTHEIYGTVWDTLFVVKPEGGRTELKMTMDAITNKLTAKIFNFLISGMIKKAVAKDLDGVKVFCER